VANSVSVIFNMTGGNVDSLVSRGLEQVPQELRRGEDNRDSGPEGGGARPRRREEGGGHPVSTQHLFHHNSLRGVVEYKGVGGCEGWSGPA
jgi:hypothetical protein